MSSFFGALELKLIDYVMYIAVLVMQLEKITSDDGNDSGLGVVTLSEALNLPLTSLALDTDTANGINDRTQETSAPLRDRRMDADTGPSSQEHQTTSIHMGLRTREETLHEFTKDGWLALFDDNSCSYVLGPRALLELGPSLLQAGRLADGQEEALKSALGYC